MEDNNTYFKINRTEKPNSYEFGKAGDRFKLYFDSTKELLDQLEELKKAGLYAATEEL